MSPDHTTTHLRQSRPAAVATEPSEKAPDARQSRHGTSRPRQRLLRLLGPLGLAAALPFFVWLPLGWFEAVPSVVDVFGMAGLRIPAGITVGGLLLAAIGFHVD